MAKEKVNCSFCDKDILRYKINPNTKKPIKNFFCDNNCKGKWQIKEREKLGFTKDWLISEYIDKNKSADKIAREIKRDPKRVWEWLKLYEIPTRPRGTDYGQSFKKGQESAFKGKRHSRETRKKMSELSKKDGRLPWGKDNEPYMKGRNGENHHSFKGGLTPERQSFYSSKEWVNVVKEVWERDNAVCQRCGKHHNETKTRGSFHIHHIVTFQNRELRAKLDNLILLCDECHRWVHSKRNKNKEYIKD